MQRHEKRIVALSVAVTLLGGWVTMPSIAVAAEEESSGECSTTAYFHCAYTYCAAYQPCSVSPGDGYHDCSGIPAGGGWYSRTQFNNFQCSA